MPELELPNSIQRFDVKRNDDDKTLIQIDGERTISLTGQSLEGQFELPDGRFILVMTEDCPYEETLTIHLLDPDFQSLDTLTYGASYESFVVESCDALSPNQLLINTNHLSFSLSIAGSQPESLVRSSASKLMGNWVGSKRFLVLTKIESDS